MKKPLQRQPFAAFTVLPSGIDGAVRHENGCAKYCTKPRNWKVSAVIRYEEGDVIREDVIDFRANTICSLSFVIGFSYIIAVSCCVEQNVTSSNGFLFGDLFASHLNRFLP